MAMGQEVGMEPAVFIGFTLGWWGVKLLLVGILVLILAKLKAPKPALAFVGIFLPATCIPSYVNTVAKNNAMVDPHRKEGIEEGFVAACERGMPTIPEPDRGAICACIHERFLRDPRREEILEHLAAPDYNPGAPPEAGGLPWDLQAREEREARICSVDFMLRLASDGCVADCARDDPRPPRCEERCRCMYERVRARHPDEEGDEWLVRHFFRSTPTVEGQALVESLIEPCAQDSVQAPSVEDGDGGW